MLKIVKTSLLLAGLFLFAFNVQVHSQAVTTLTAVGWGSFAEFKANTTLSGASHGFVWGRGTQILGSTNGGGAINPGDFYGCANDLAPETEYFVKAFVIKSNNSIVWGNSVTFTTPKLPTTEITKNVDGLAEFKGFSSVLPAYTGFVWGLSDNPTLPGNGSTNKSRIPALPGYFTDFTNNLAPETDYYVRAYITTGTGVGQPRGTVYGNSVKFTTPKRVGGE